MNTKKWKRSQKKSGGIKNRKVEEVKKKKQTMEKKNGEQDKGEKIAENDRPLPHGVGRKGLAKKPISPTPNCDGSLSYMYIYIHLDKTYGQQMQYTKNVLG